MTLDNIIMIWLTAVIHARKCTIEDYAQHNNNSFTKNQLKPWYGFEICTATNTGSNYPAFIVDLSLIILKL
jgi:hypothetical protein